jgi:hypothetical protein
LFPVRDDEDENENDSASVQVLFSSVSDFGIAFYEKYQ